MLVYETVRRARNIGLQHVNMSSKCGTYHLAWFSDVLGTFLRRFGRQRTASELYFLGGNLTRESTQQKIIFSTMPDFQAFSHIKYVISLGEPLPAAIRL